ncbi:MAG TPA: co-chaperone GroES [Anaerolineae bacterium]|nr:co-chaperone GroES [Anaerolineae bacterium]
MAAKAKETKKVNLRPLADRVIVEPIEREEVTPSGIVIPETAKERPQEGLVLAVGPGKLDERGERIPMEVKEGDRVLFAKYAGTEVKLEGDRKVLVLRESDILAIVES